MSVSCGTIRCMAQITTAAKYLSPRRIQSIDPLNMPFHWVVADITTNLRVARKSRTTPPSTLYSGRSGIFSKEYFVYCLIGYIFLYRYFGEIATGIIVPTGGLKRTCAVFIVFATAVIHPFITVHDRSMNTRERHIPTRCWRVKNPIT